MKPYPSDRLASYSDAVFSIAVTLPVLEIRLPERGVGRAFRVRHMDRGRGIPFNMIWRHASGNRTLLARGSDSAFISR